MSNADTGPGAIRRFVNQRMIPVSIDTAAAVEAAAEMVAVRVRTAPLVALGSAVGLGVLLGMLGPRRQAAALPGRKACAG